MAFAVPNARAYDRKVDNPTSSSSKQADYLACGVRAAESNAAAIRGASLILSVVTANEALAAARESAAAIGEGALYCDLNSIAPDTKRAACGVIEASGGRYVDVAVMSPVHPARLAAPLLISGPHAIDAAAALTRAGFTNMRVIEGPVGGASAIKMIRSVMVKGLEALTAECFLAASAAGVLDDVQATLNASWPGTNWGENADYNLNRMMVHGIRRAAEMEEVVKTLDGLGTGSVMSRGTVEWQRAIGSAGHRVPNGLSAKLDLLRTSLAEAA